MLLLITIYLNRKQASVLQKAWRELFVNDHQEKTVFVQFP